MSKKNLRTSEGPIVTTTGMIGDVARNIVGNTRPVTSLINEGADPHIYIATKGDIDHIVSASLILYNGHHLEGKMASILSKRKNAIALSEQDLEKELLRGQAGQVDPHLWMDVSLWSAVAQHIGKHLTGLCPQNAALYRQNLARYQQKLERLDSYATQAIASIPADQRVLITAHDAFSYLGRAYQIEVRAIQGISTDSEAGSHEIEELVDFVVSRKIPAIFVESSVSKKSIQAVVEGAAARGHTLRLGGELYSDALGPAGSYQGTYIGMIDHNITTIVKALGGSVPPRGFQNQLSH